MTKVNQINNHSKAENQSNSKAEFFVGASLQSSYSDNKIWNVSLSTNGSEIIVLSQRQSLTHSRVNPDMNIKLKAYNNTKISIAGKCELSIKRLGKSFNSLFIVVEVSLPSILSANSSTQLKLAK